MAKNKTTETEVKVTDFIAAIDHDKKRSEAQIILDLFQKITHLKPKMWGPTIIGFGSYHYKYDSGHEGDAPLMGFSPRKAKHVLYVLTNFEGQEEMLDRLGKYKTGKVCLYVNKLADVDLAVLEEIIVACYKDSLAKYT